MFKALGKTLMLLCLATIGTAGMLWYRHITKGDARISQLEQEKAALEQVVERLNVEHRVAEILVTDQRTENGRQVTDLLLVETDRDGNALPPKKFTVTGDKLYVDGLAIHFKREFVESGDGLRGHAVVLLQRLYGDETAPSSGSLIDQPGQIPAVYRGADPKVSQYELKLWADFWRLTNDNAYRNQAGVEVAQGEAVYQQIKPDMRYVVRVQANGGMTMTPEPLPALYREALRQHLEMKSQSES